MAAHPTERGQQLGILQTSVGQRTLPMVGTSSGGPADAASSSAASAQARLEGQLSMFRPDVLYEQRFAKDMQRSAGRDARCIGMPTGSAARVYDFILTAGSGSGVRRRRRAHEWGLERGPLLPQLCTALTLLCIDLLWVRVR